MLEAPLTSLRARYFPVSMDAAAELVVIVAAVMGFLYVLSGYFALPTLPIYGHDAVHYYVDFHFKLVEDGRWLNFLLHDFLRSWPLPLWSLLFLTLNWLLFYRLARSCAIEAPLAALVASTTIVATPLLEISLWPATVGAAVLLTWLAVLMQARGISYPVIYMVSGVLIFGSLQTYYFVLPLLFLPQFLDTSQPLRARLLLLFRHMLWWVAGSVAGVLFMMLMLWPLAGMFFPQPAQWRNVQPAVDLSSLLDNIRYVITNFASLLPELLRLGGVTWAFGIICVVAAVLRARTLQAQLPALLLMAAVLIAFFVFSVPMAPVIHVRSLIATAAVLILFVALLPGKSAAGRIVAALLLLRLAQHYAEACQDYLEAQRSETAVYVHALQDLMRGYSWQYTALALDGTMDGAKPEARRFNDGSLMHPLMISLGVRNFLDCRIPGRCDGVELTGETVSVQPFAGGQLELLVNAANVGIVRYRD